VSRCWYYATRRAESEMGMKRSEAMEYTVKRLYTRRDLIARDLPTFPFINPSTVMEWDIKLDLLGQLTELAAANGDKIDAKSLCLSVESSGMDWTMTVEATAKALVEA
jgi:hypothetical protein